MQKSWQIFLVSFFVACPLWWSFNAFGENLGQIVFFRALARDPYLLTAQVGPVIHRPRPALSLTAKEVLAIKLGNESQAIVFDKNSRQKLPIASLSKLLTALVVLENYKLTDEVSIGQAAVDQEENIGLLKAGERLSVEGLLHSSLMESSNDAAYALAEVMGNQRFVDLCNQTAARIGLANTHFVNANGLIIDGQTGEAAENYSTAQDLAKLAVYLLKNQPLVWEILSKREYPLLRPDGALHHLVKTTNELLGQDPSVAAGKTGWTETAGGCLLTVTNGPAPDTFFVNVILGSDDRFGEMRKLIDWLNASQI